MDNWGLSSFFFITIACMACRWLVLVRTWSFFTKILVELSSAEPEFLCKFSPKRSAVCTPLWQGVHQPNPNWIVASLVFTFVVIIVCIPTWWNFLYRITGDHPTSESGSKPNFSRPYAGENFGPKLNLSHFTGNDDWVSPRPLIHP